MTECMRPDCVAAVCDYETRIAELEAENKQAKDILTRWLEFQNDPFDDINLTDAMGMLDLFIKEVEEWLKEETV